LSRAELLGRPGRTWQAWFPFSDREAQWTFSGRVALYHGLPSLNLRQGSTILVPAYHQGVEIDTLLAAGYRIRYYRLDERLVLDLADVERRLDKTVSALYVIHYFGFPQPLATIRRFCDAHRIALIEDCAISLFSQDRTVALGSVGDLALFSVYKTVALPHGGILVTKSRRASPSLGRAPLASTFAQTLDLFHEGLKASGWTRTERWLTRAIRGAAATVRWQRSRAVSSGIGHWDPRLLAHGASAWAAWLMRRVDPADVVAKRRRNFERLASHLHGLLSLPFPTLPPGVCPLFLPVIVPDKARFQEGLARQGVGSADWWSRSHPTCPPELVREVAGWRRHCLELPIHQALSPSDMDRIADAVIRVQDDADSVNRGSERHDVSARARDGSTTMPSIIGSAGVDCLARPAEPRPAGS
jgi:dTDP-4-amino-4,6-dideoxygalactose transaminase